MSAENRIINSLEILSEIQEKYGLHGVEFVWENKQELKKYTSTYVIETIPKSLVVGQPLVLIGKGETARHLTRHLCLSPAPPWSVTPSEMKTNAIAMS